MKNLRQTFATTLMMASLLFVASFASASNGTPASSEKSVKAAEDFAYSLYPIINTNKIRFCFQQKTAEKVYVKIYDEAGTKVYTDMQEAQFARLNYDLSNVGEGTYQVRIKSGDFQATEMVKVGVNTNRNFSAYLSPAPVNDKIRIAFQHAGQPVSISLTNNKGKVLYQKYLSRTEFSTLFNISQLQPGDYTIRISSAGKVTTQTYQL